MNVNKLSQLKLFVKQCVANPALLQDPSLRFFRSYLERPGAKLPATAYGKSETAKDMKTGFRQSYVRACSSIPRSEGIDEEVEKKTGWLLKAIAFVTLAYVGMNVFPLIGESMVKHSVALLRTKDPLFKRSGASRLDQIATDDARRLKIVEAGGVEALAQMLESADDDDTRREAVKALANLSQCDAATEVLHGTGVGPLLHALAMKSPDPETLKHSSLLTQRFAEWKARHE